MLLQRESRLDRNLETIDGLGDAFNKVRYGCMRTGLDGLCDIGTQEAGEVSTIVLECALQACRDVEAMMTSCIHRLPYRGSVLMLSDSQPSFVELWSWMELSACLVLIETSAFAQLP